MPEYMAIEKAAIRIQPHYNLTPVLTSKTINDMTGSEIFFKCENFQKAGSFKFRGACNAVFSLSDAEADRGVATHSSGNHGQALALAASLRNISAHIVMPENSPKVKVNAVKDYGAEITFCEATQKAREYTLEMLIEKTGAQFIHPYDNADVIAGQGTAAKELIFDHPALDMILAPIGGGGLMSGTAIASKHLRPGMSVIGSEPELADDAFQSLKKGSVQKFDTTKTIADGLRTTLCDRTFTIIQSYVDQIVTVSDESIIEAMRLVWERMNIIIEASCAVPVAALLNGKIDSKGKKIGVILTGGNVDLDNLPWNRQIRD